MIYVRNKNANNNVMRHINKSVMWGRISHFKVQIDATARGMVSCCDNWKENNQKHKNAINYFYVKITIHLSQYKVICKRIFDANWYRQGVNTLLEQ